MIISSISIRYLRCANSAGSPLVRKNDLSYEVIFKKSGKKVRSNTALYVVFRVPTSTFNS